MRSLAPATRSRRGEPTIALINVVFLMLVFFLVAGTLARPLDRDLKLVTATDLDASPPPDALVIHPDGRLLYRGVPTSPEAHLVDLRTQGVGEATDGRDGHASAGPLVRLVPDRQLPASELVRITSELRSAGAGRLVIVTERALR